MIQSGEGHLVSLSSFVDRQMMSISGVLALLKASVRLSLAPPLSNITRTVEHAFLWTENHIGNKSNCTEAIFRREFEAFIQ